MKQEDGRHRLVVSTSTEYPLLKNQRVMSKDDPRARIPLGAMHTLWQAHQKMLQGLDGYDSHCAKCGKDDNEDHNKLLLCDSDKCPRVQHRLCSNLNPQMPEPELWYCDTCVTLQSFNTPGHPHPSTTDTN